MTRDNRNQCLCIAAGRICAVAGTPIAESTIMTGCVYDAEGRRVAKGTITRLSCAPSVNGLLTVRNDTAYIPGEGSEQITELAQDADGSMPWQRTNVRAGGKLVGTYDINGLHFSVDDPLGSRRVQTDYAGVLEQTCGSLPFGDGLNCTGSVSTPTEHHFTAKERDSESGNDYFGARYYASAMGRFLSPDPVHIKANRLTDPQRLNLYVYGRDNPLSFIDPDGADPIKIEQKTYSVGGATASEAWENARKNSGLGDARGQTTWGGFKFSYKTNTMTTIKPSGDSTTTETVKDAHVTADVTITLPIGSGRDQASPEQQQLWDSAVSGLQEHEQGHADIVQKNVDQTQNDLNGTTGQGSGKSAAESIDNADQDTKSNVQQKVDSEMEQTQKQSDAYDESNHHGEKP